MAPEGTGTPKPGYRTTEFWITLATTTGMILVATGVWEPSNSAAVQQAVQTAATAVAGGLPALYALTRALTKAFTGGRRT